jgi:hypothetical protein
MKNVTGLLKCDVVKKDKVYPITGLVALKGR